QLVLTTVTGGAASGRVIGELPDTGGSQRHVRWTVDEFGGHAAWVDGQERVHIVPSGVPANQPLTSLDADDASHVRAKDAGTVPSRVTGVMLSKPAARWTLTVRDAVTGRTVDTVTGGPARGRLDVGWHGIRPSASRDVFLPNGRYAWTLSVAPADGVGPDLRHSGAFELYDGSPVRRDHTGGDGLGDALTLNSKGGLTFHAADGTGRFGYKVSASGWSASVVAVPFGDLDGDRCNDVLVRMTDGSLRGYRPGCGK
ncbi:VCBS repeat-containing protein, partial [Streptomyces sp. DH37]|nr:VCBS repeat-containing protein [Streptomyces sp. DH37]